MSGPISVSVFLRGSHCRMYIASNVYMLLMAVVIILMDKEAREFPLDVYCFLVGSSKAVW